MTTPAGRVTLTATNKAGADPNTKTLTAWFDAQQRDFLVYRLSITGPVGSLATVYAGVSNDPGSYRSTSYFGQQDDADYPAGLLVPVGSQLLITWRDITGGIATPVPITNAAAGVTIAHAEIEF